MLKTLFDPRGTIESRTYWHGCVSALVIMTASFTLALFAVFSFGTDARFLSYLMWVGVFALGCMMSKRLATLGYSRWWTAALFGIIASIFLILVPILQSLANTQSGLMVNVMMAQNFAPFTVGQKVSLYAGMLPVFFLSLVPFAGVAVGLGLWSKPSGGQLSAV